MTCTMLPPSPSSIWFPNTCVMFQVPVRLVSITAFQPFGLKWRAGCGYWPPALLTSTSIFPTRSCAAAARASTDSRSRMFTWAVSTRRPVAAWISRAASSRGSGRRAASSRSAPASARARAISRPSPVPPPVTNAVRPSSRSEAKAGLGGASAIGGHSRRVAPALL
jgi:hypothetical protein